MKKQFFESLVYHSPNEVTVHADDADIYADKWSLLGDEEANRVVITVEPDLDNLHTIFRDSAYA